MTKNFDPSDAFENASTFFEKIFDIIKTIWPVGLAILVFLLIGVLINWFIALIGFVAFIALLIYIYKKLKN